MVYIDGPFGSPSSNIYRSGTGILEIFGFFGRRDIMKWCHKALAREASYGLHRLALRFTLQQYLQVIYRYWNFGVLFGGGRDIMK
jgi:hypothetical protein